MNKKGIDQVDAAKKGGMSASFLSKVLNHHRDPRYNTILKMAAGLEVEPWELFVDYDAGQIGPLKKQEKALISNYRLAPSDKDREIFSMLVENSAKKPQ